MYAPACTSLKYVRRCLPELIVVVALIGLILSFFITSQTKQVITARGDSAYIPYNGGGSGTQEPDHVNPPLRVDCASPRLTVAVMVDRSDSVVKNGDVTTPDAFKDSIYFLLDGLYSRFVPQGQVDVYIYAFGTRSILQNARNVSGEPITNISSPSLLADMKQAISRIHFRDGNTFVSNNDEFRTLSGDTPGYQRASNDPWDRARAYNAGSESHRGDYGNTNWHDALLNVANETTYRNKIDLAIMLTDGSPTASNAGDLYWTPGSYEGPKYEDYGRSDDLHRVANYEGAAWFAEKVVNQMRAGVEISAFGNGQIPPRNPVSIRGIMIQPKSAPTNEVDAAKMFSKQVFGEEYFKLTTDFNVELKNEISNLINQITNETGCFNGNPPVVPGISLSASESNIAVTEGKTQPIKFTITNTSDILLKNVKLCFGVFDAEAWKCKDEAYNYKSLQSHESIFKTRLYDMKFGGLGGTQTVTAFGEADATPSQLGGASGLVYDQLSITVTPIRLNLPS